MISVDAFLSTPGDPVIVVERASDDGAAFWSRLEVIAPWLRVERKRDGTEPRKTDLCAVRPHGEIAFIGDLEQRLLEPLVETLRALATGEIDWDTPATPALFRHAGAIRTKVAVSPACPYCPRVAAALLRFAVASPAVAVEVVRADGDRAWSEISALPSVWVGEREVAAGAIGEFALAERVLGRASRGP